MLEGDSSSEDLPAYQRWPDIVPYYVTLRKPEEYAQAMSEPASPCPSYPSSPRSDSSVLHPSPPPSPTPARVALRKPLSERFNLAPEALEAAARDAARKQVQAEMERAGHGWAGPLAQHSTRYTV
ncbi:hypothetical protein CALCODRAFT_480703 [Calocera cornea HHB12733]|uniref:Uncharacterized protein n=1 Tax=Calocera cornea HHB12733 TaxID=1353952 RepID=A0A165ID01_9BASI|nr:hypothetical protein CALCODRAFT_480703 [Calocera cornea HHB12733]